MKQLQKVPKCNINLCIDDRIVRIDENMKHNSWAPREIVFPIRYLAYLQHPVPFYINTDTAYTAIKTQRAYIWQTIQESKYPFCTTTVQYDEKANKLSFYPMRKE